MAELVRFLRESGPASLKDLLGRGGTRSRLINLFIALLELIRQQQVRARQEEPFGEIRIELLPAPE